MKVLAGPRVDLGSSAAVARLCGRLAGEDGQVVPLASLGLRDPYRRFSAAEVAALRGVLRGETGRWATYAGERRRGRRRDGSLPQTRVGSRDSEPPGGGHRSRQPYLAFAPDGTQRRQRRTPLPEHGRYLRTRGRFGAGRR